MKIFLTAAIAGLLVMASANASSIAYDQTLASPDGGTTPGWFNGTGNPNGGFTTATQAVAGGDVVLAVRAKERQSPNVIDSPDGVYHVPIGAQPGAPTRADWNYEFSADLGALTGLNFGNTIILLNVTNVNTGATSLVNAGYYWNDDSQYGPGGKSTAAGPVSLTSWELQNSENPSFGDFPLAASFNMNVDATYRFDLTARIIGGANIATDSMTVVVGNGGATPEPATFALIGLPLVAVWKFRRRKV